MARSAWYWTISEARGSRRIRAKSSRVRSLQLDADREPALQLGHQVGRLGPVEGPGGDEEDVVGLDRPVLGVDGRPLDDRQEVALDALAGDVGPLAAAVLAAGDLVDLVEEDDPRFLGQGDGRRG